MNTLVDDKATTRRAPRAASISNRSGNAAIGMRLIQSGMLDGSVRALESAPLRDIGTTR